MCIASSSSSSSSSSSNIVAIHSSEYPIHHHDHAHLPWPCGEDGSSLKLDTGYSEILESDFKKERPCAYEMARMMHILETCNSMKMSGQLQEQ